MRVPNVLTGCGHPSGPLFQRPTAPGPPFSRAASSLPLKSSSCASARNSLRVRNPCAPSAGSRFLKVLLFLTLELAHIPFTTRNAAFQPLAAETLRHGACQKCTAVRLRTHQLPDAVLLRSGTASRRNAIYNRTNRLYSLGPQPCPVPFRAGSAHLCRSKRPPGQPM